MSTIADHGVKNQVTESISNLSLDLCQSPLLVPSGQSQESEGCSVAMQCVGEDQSKTTDEWAQCKETGTATESRQPALSCSARHGMNQYICDHTAAALGSETRCQWVEDNIQGNAIENDLTENVTEFGLLLEEALPNARKKDDVLIPQKRGNSSIQLENTTDQGYLCDQSICVCPKIPKLNLDQPVSSQSAQRNCASSLAGPGFDTTSFHVIENVKEHREYDNPEQSHDSTTLSTSLNTKRAESGSNSNSTGDVENLHKGLSHLAMRESCLSDERSSVNGWHTQGLEECTIFKSRVASADLSICSVIETEGVCKDRTQQSSDINVQSINDKSPVQPEIKSTFRSFDGNANHEVLIHAPSLQSYIHYEPHGQSQTPQDIFSGTAVTQTFLNMPEEKTTKSSVTDDRNTTHSALSMVHTDDAQNSNASQMCNRHTQFTTLEHQSDMFASDFPSQTYQKETELMIWWKNLFLFLDAHQRICPFQKDVFQSMPGSVKPIYANSQHSCKPDDCNDVKNHLSDVPTSQDQDHRIFDGSNAQNQYCRRGMNCKYLTGNQTFRPITSKQQYANGGSYDNNKTTGKVTLPHLVISSPNLTPQHNALSANTRDDVNDGGREPGYSQQQSQVTSSIVHNAGVNEASKIPGMHPESNCTTCSTGDYDDKGRIQSEMAWAQDVMDISTKSMKNRDETWHGKLTGTPTASLDHVNDVYCVKDVTKDFQQTKLNEDTYLDDKNTPHEPEVSNCLEGIIQNTLIDRPSSPLSYESEILNTKDEDTVTEDDHILLGLETSTFGENDDTGEDWLDIDSEHEILLFMEDHSEEQGAFSVNVLEHRVAHLLPSSLCAVDDIADRKTKHPRSLVQELRKQMHNCSNNTVIRSPSSVQDDDSVTNGHQHTLKIKDSKEVLLARDNGVGKAVHFTQDTKEGSSSTQDARRVSNLPIFSLHNPTVRTVSGSSPRVTSFNNTHFLDPGTDNITYPDPPNRIKTPSGKRRTCVGPFSGFGSSSQTASSNRTESVRNVDTTYARQVQPDTAQVSPVQEFASEDLKVHDGQSHASSGRKSRTRHVQLRNQNGQEEKLKSSPSRSVHEEYPGDPRCPRHEQERSDKRGMKRTKCDCRNRVYGQARRLLRQICYLKSKEEMLFRAAIRFQRARLQMQEHHSMLFAGNWDCPERHKHHRSLHSSFDSSTCGKGGKSSRSKKANVGKRSSRPAARKRPSAEIMVGDQSNHTNVTDEEQPSTSRGYRFKLRPVNKRPRWQRSVKLAPARGNENQGEDGEEEEDEEDVKTESHTSKTASSGSSMSLKATRTSSISYGEGVEEEEEEDKERLDEDEEDEDVDDDESISTRTLSRGEESDDSKLFPQNSTRRKKKDGDDESETTDDDSNDPRLCGFFREH